MGTLTSESLHSCTPLSCIVLGWLGRWSIRSGVTSRHTTIDNKVSTVDEAALVAGKEEDTLGLLDGLAKATGWEVDFAAVALSLVVAKPVLQQRCATIISMFTTKTILSDERTSVALGIAR